MTPAVLDTSAVVALMMKDAALKLSSPISKVR
jgi:hypothetical protein